MELRRFRADLHIHSCLSPCGELTVYPRRIVELALEKELDIIALSDHNTAENAEAAIQAAEGTRLTVLPAMELTTEEEVHILGLFGAMDDVLAAQEEIFRKLPRYPADSPLIREQVIVNKNDEVTGFHPKCLIASSGLDIYEMVDLIHRNGGLAIASHIDRNAFSIICQLGFIPPDINLDAFEISPFLTVPEARELYPSCAHRPLVRFSDAHRPEEIGRTTTDFLLVAPVVEEIRMALQETGGRRICGP